MSYTIEYNREIFFTESDGAKEYFLFIRQGDNNVYEANNLRAKDWYYVIGGDINALWKKIGYRGGWCEGGSLQRAKGWSDTVWMTIEEYIALYRSKIRNAKPLETFLDKFKIEAYAYIKDSYTNPREEVEVISRFIKDYNMQHIGVGFYDKDKKHYIYKIKNYEELLDFLKNYPRGYNSDYHSGFRIERLKRRR